jgi:uncharacterized DUF497 family protein
MNQALDWIGWPRVRIGIDLNPFGRAEAWRANLAKRGVSFAQAATVLIDPLALTVFDAAHSRDEERWFTLGTASDGKLLAVAHTFQHTGPDNAEVRII